MDALFTDLSTTNGDLTVTLQGDLDTVSGTDNLTAALQRRFETSVGALFCDTTYGNPLLDRLSAPMGLNFEREAIGDVADCINGDPRVQRVQVDVKLDRENRTAWFKVSYVANDGSAGSFERAVSLRV